MKKIVLLLVAFVAFSYGEQAQAATAAAPAATAATPQQNRMKSCAAKYHQQKIAKSQYRAFMSTCLKNPANATNPDPAKVVPGASK